MCPKGLPYLLMRGSYQDAFILHDESELEYEDEDENRNRKRRRKGPSEWDYREDPRQDLNDTWTLWTKYQPMWRIRNYFGEKIGFYFAWQGTLITTLWFPTLLGLCIFFYGLYLSILRYQNGRELQTEVPDTNTTLLNGTVAASNQTDSSLLADIADFAEDTLGIIKESFDNAATPYFALVICLWGTIFLEVWKRRNATLAYEWDVDNFENTEPDRPQFYGTKVKEDPVTGQEVWYYPFQKQFTKFLTSCSVVILMICIVIISMIGVIIYRVWARIFFQSGDMFTRLMLSTVCSSCMNAVSIMLLGWVYKWIAVKLTDWENFRTQTRYDDALIIKLFAFQFANSYASLFYIAFVRKHGETFFTWFGLPLKDDCGIDETCMSELSFQVLILMLFKPAPKVFTDLLLPWLKKKWKQCKCCFNNKIDKSIDTADTRLPVNDFIEKERQKPELGDFTLSEYNEKVIQYGYQMLFAASFPLAPLLAILTNLFDMRVDARRLLWWNRRPLALIAQDIGTWYSILEFVNVAGVISNAFLVAFTATYFQSFSTIDKLWVVIVFEHLVFAVKWIIAYMIPDVPASVRLAIRKEKFQVSKLMSGFPSTAAFAEPRSQVSWDDHDADIPSPFKPYTITDGGHSTSGYATQTTAIASSAMDQAYPDSTSRKLSYGDDGETYVGGEDKFPGESRHRKKKKKKDRSEKTVASEEQTESYA